LQLFFFLTEKHLQDNFQFSIFAFLFFLDYLTLFYHSTSGQLQIESKTFTISSQQQQQQQQHLE
jgi:hypothetical protein